MDEKITLRVPPEMKANLKKDAKKVNRTLSNYILTKLSDDKEKNTSV
jgi:predicted DNA-binding protein